MKKEFIVKAGLFCVLEEELEIKTSKKTFSKGDIITNIGQVENHIYYIRSGAVKISCIHDNKDYILDFWFAHDFFSCYASFIERSPSLTRAVALSHTEVEYISCLPLEKQYEHSLVANKIGRIMAEKMYVHKFNKEVNLLTKSAKERYSELFKRSPEVVKLLPVKDIASFLGIHPDSLSRIRRNVTS